MDIFKCLSTYLSTTVTPPPITRLKSHKLHILNEYKILSIYYSINEVLIIILLIRGVYTSINTSSISMTTGQTPFVDDS